MITFYPRDLAMWREDFDFNPPITLVTHQKTNYRVFRDQDEFFDFLKHHGVRLDDPKFPLIIEDDPSISKIRNIPGLRSVVQWSLIGWIKNDFR